MFPDTLVFLGATDGWFAFKQPRWFHLRKDASYIIRLIQNKMQAVV